MNCYQHADKPAVAVCISCNVGICPICVDDGLTFNGKPLCLSCAPEALSQGIREFISTRRRNFAKLVLAGLVMGVGVAVALANLVSGSPDSTTEAVFAIVLFFGIAGIFSMVGNSSPAKPGRTLIVAGPGVAEGMLLGGCIGVVLTFLFGAVIAPINLYRYWLVYRNSDKAIGEHKQLLDRVTARISK